MEETEEEAVRKKAYRNNLKEFLKMDLEDPENPGTLQYPKLPTQVLASLASMSIEEREEKMQQFKEKYMLLKQKERALALKLKKSGMMLSKN